MEILRFVLVFLFIPISCVNAQPLVVDATDNPVGIFLEHFSQTFQNHWTPSTTRNMHVSTSTGYLFNLETIIVFVVNPGTGEPIPVHRAFVSGYWLDDTPDQSNSRHYQSSDCSGQAFLPTNTSGVITTSRVFSANPSELWYVPKREALVFKAFGSRHNWNTEGVCEQLDPVRETLAARAFPNDPGTTGIFSAEFDAPVEITSGIDRNQMSCIFKDGFEC